MFELERAFGIQITRGEMEKASRGDMSSGLSAVSAASTLSSGVRSAVTCLRAAGAEQARQRMLRQALGDDGIAEDSQLSRHHALVLQPDGKIVVGGGFTSFNNIQRNGIARLNTDGTLDMTFDPGFGVNGVVRSVAIQSDGKIVIAGEFSQVDGENRFNIARLNTDGSVDASFDPGLGSDGVIWSVAIVETPTLKIYAGGEFLDFNGSFRGNIVRLNADGSVDSSFEPGGGADRLGDVAEHDLHLHVAGRAESLAGHVYGGQRHVQHLHSLPRTGIDQTT